MFKLIQKNKHKSLYYDEIGVLTKIYNEISSNDLSHLKIGDSVVVRTHQNPVILQDYSGCGVITNVLPKKGKKHIFCEI